MFYILNRSYYILVIYLDNYEDYLSNYFILVGSFVGHQQYLLLLFVVD
jgi:hypothetical protein